MGNNNACGQEGRLSKIRSRNARGPEDRLSQTRKRNARGLEGRLSEIRECIAQCAYDSVHRILDEEKYEESTNNIIGSKILSKLLSLNILVSFNRGEFDERTQDLLNALSVAQMSEAQTSRVTADVTTLPPAVGMVIATMRNYRNSLMSYTTRMYDFESYLQLVIRLARRSILTDEEYNVDYMAREIGLDQITIEGPVTSRESLIFNICSYTHTLPNSVIQNRLAMAALDELLSRIIPPDVMNIMAGYAIKNWTKDWRLQQIRDF